MMPALVTAFELLRRPTISYAATLDKFAGVPVIFNHEINWNAESPDTLELRSLAFPYESQSGEESRLERHLNF